MKAAKIFQHKKNTNNNGFTLIEILVVIAIASILAMVSLPFYQNYSARAKISGEFSIMHPLMLRMDEEYALNNRWPSNNKEAGAREPAYYNGKYLSSAEVGDNPQEGTMTLTYNTDELPVLQGTNTLVFYPGSSSGDTGWKCDQGTIPSKYRPPNCRPTPPQ